jgi:hypothetical protein
LPTGALHTTANATANAAHHPDIFTMVRFYSLSCG